MGFWSKKQDAQETSAQTEQEDTVITDPLLVEQLNRLLHLDTSKLSNEQMTRALSKAYDKAAKRNGF